MDRIYDDLVDSLHCNVFRGRAHRYSWPLDKGRGSSLGSRKSRSFMTPSTFSRSLHSRLPNRATDRPRERRLLTSDKTRWPCGRRRRCLISQSDLAAFHFGASQSPIYDFAFRVRSQMQSDGGKLKGRSSPCEKDNPVYPRENSPRVESLDRPISCMFKQIARQLGFSMKNRSARKRSLERGMIGTGVSLSTVLRRY